MIKKRSFFWVIFCFILIAEFFLFHHYAYHNIVGFFPGVYDQTTYLKDSYVLFESIKMHGLSHADIPWSFNGILFQCLSVGLFFLFGTSRFTALSLGFIFFALMQWTVALAAWKRYQSVFMVFLVWGLCIASYVLYARAGGLFDFRMDFSAVCLYGAFVSLFVLSERFTVTRVNYAIGVVIFLLIGVRFITATYVVGFLGSYLFCCLLWDKQSKKTIQSTLCLLAWSFFCVLIIFAFFYKDLYGYYFIGHVAGGEKTIRLAEQGIYSLSDRLTFYPVNFWNRELAGPLKYYVLTLILISLYLYACSFFLSPRDAIRESQKTLNPASSRGMAMRYLLSLLLFILVPYGVLTLDEVKSPIVTAIALIPFMWFITELFYFAYTATPISATKKGAQVLVAIISLSCFWMMSHRLWEDEESHRLASWKVITSLYFDIGDRVIAAHHNHINISFDKIIEYLSSNGISDLYYETYHRWITIDVTHLGGQIFPLSKKEAMDALLHSDFVVFTRDCPGYQYPMNQSVEAMRPALEKALAKNFKQVAVYTNGECQLMLYQRFFEEQS